MERFDVIRGAERRETQRCKVAHPFADITNDYDDLKHCAPLHHKKVSDRPIVIEPSSLSLHSARTAYGTATPSGAEEENPLKRKRAIPEEEKQGQENGLTPRATKGGFARRRRDCDEAHHTPDEDNDVALGDVWLTATQEKDIANAGPARRAAAAACAMCPASVGDSNSSVAKPGGPSSCPPPDSCDRTEHPQQQPQNDEPPPQEAERTPVRDGSVLTPAITPCTTPVVHRNAAVGAHQQLCHMKEAVWEASDASLAADTQCDLPQAAVEPFLLGGGRRRLEAKHEQTCYLSGPGARREGAKFTAATRQLLVDWILLRQHRLRLGDATVHLAMQLTDELLADKDPEKFLANESVVDPSVTRCSEGCDDFPSACLPAMFEPGEGAKYHLQRAPFPLKLCRLAATCLFVAAKLLEPQAECPTAETFAKEACSQHLGFHAGQLLQAEASLLSTLNYSLIRPTAICFSGAFLSALRNGIRVPAEGSRKAPPRRASSQGRRSQPPPAPSRARAPSIDFPTFARASQATRYILDVALQSHTSLKMRQSELAAAALWLSCGPNTSQKAAAAIASSSKRGVLSRQEFERITGYPIKDIAPCAEYLLSLCRDAENYPYLYIHRKHAGARAHVKLVLGL